MLFHQNDLAQSGFLVGQFDLREVESRCKDMPHIICPIPRDMMLTGGQRAAGQETNFLTEDVEQAQLYIHLARKFKRKHRCGVERIRIGRRE